MPSGLEEQKHPEQPEDIVRASTMRYVKTTSVVISLIEDNNSDETGNKMKVRRNSQNEQESRATMNPPMLIDEQN